MGATTFPGGNLLFPDHGRPAPDENRIPGQYDLLGGLERGERIVPAARIGVVSIDCHEIGGDL